MLGCGPQFDTTVKRQDTVEYAILAGTRLVLSLGVVLAAEQKGPTKKVALGVA
jgi:hypothetical protein